MADIKIVEVSYKGSQASITATISGEVQGGIFDVGWVVPYMKSGKLRALAVTSVTPSLVVPELPTVAASGLPGYEYVGATGILAPGKTPAAIINRLNREIVRVLPGLSELTRRIRGLHNFPQRRCEAPGQRRSCAIRRSEYRSGITTALLLAQDAKAPGAPIWTTRESVT